MPTPHGQFCDRCSQEQQKQHTFLALYCHEGPGVERHIKEAPLFWGDCCLEMEERLGYPPQAVGPFAQYYWHVPTCLGPSPGGWQLRLLSVNCFKDTEHLGAHAGKVARAARAAYSVTTNNCWTNTAPMFIFLLQLASLMGQKSLLRKHQTWPLRRHHGLITRATILQSTLCALIPSLTCSRLFPLASQETTQSILNQS